MTRAIAGARRLGGLALFALALAACESGEPANDQTGSVVTGSVGAGTNIERFDVRRQGRPLIVRVFNRGEGLRTVAVSSRSIRGLDRSDARMAYDAAFEAAQEIDCSGSPMAVDAGSAQFQEEGRRSAFTQGEAAWIFQGRCGA
ncbi:MAG: hypothetical protein AAGD13_09930 [Pseudomonadota bacterium]